MGFFFLIKVLFFSINPNAAHDDLYKLLPNLSNFSSDRPVYEWAPVTNFSDIPNHAIEAGKDKGGISFYVGRIFDENGDFNLIKVSSSMMIEDGQFVDVLVGRGVKWMAGERFNELRVEKLDGNFMIGRSDNDLKLVNSQSIEAEEILCIDDREVYNVESNDYIFRRSRW